MRAVLLWLWGRPQAQSTQHKVDGVTPKHYHKRCQQLPAPPTSGYYTTKGENNKIQATVTFSENVTVTGTPQLRLKIGGSSKLAQYKIGSNKNTTALVFAYTVVAGDADSDGISVDAIQLNGGTIQDECA